MLFKFCDATGKPREQNTIAAIRCERDSKLAPRELKSKLAIRELKSKPAILGIINTPADVVHTCCCTHPGECIKHQSGSLDSGRNATSILSASQYIVGKSAMMHRQSRLAQCLRSNRSVPAQWRSAYVERLLLLLRLTNLSEQARHVIASLTLRLCFATA